MPLKSLIRLLFALSIVLFSLPSPAAGAYAGSAPVASQSDEDRAAALRSAFGQVIVKLTGSSAALSRPDIVRAMSRADRYMQSYGYEKDAAQPGHLQLVVQFERSGIDALLRDLNLDAAPADSVAAPPAGGVDGAAPATAVPAAGSYRLWITGLRSAEDYARLVGSLNGNDQVRALQVEQGHGNTVQVRIDARGNLPALLDALGAARIAHASNTQPPVAGVDALLDFDP
ncbi:MAG: DUF2066 domain-containing protein [Rudaea sp.]